MAEVKVVCFDLSTSAAGNSREQLSFGTSSISLPFRCYYRRKSRVAHADRLGNLWQSLVQPVVCLFRRSYLEFRHPTKSQRRWLLSLESRLVSTEKE